MIDWILWELSWWLGGRNGRKVEIRGRYWHRRMAVKVTK